VQEHGSKYRDLDRDTLIELGVLIRDHRQGVLATVDGSVPYAATTAYAAEQSFAGFLVHLSDLSAHKWHLRANPKASLLVHEPEDEEGEVLQLRRLSLVCDSAFMRKDTPEYEAAARTYLDKFPHHKLTFKMNDFDLVRLVPRSGLLNAGFGRAYRVTTQDLEAAYNMAVHA